MTVYGVGGSHDGNPLWCGGAYDEARGPWVALDADDYLSGRARCGDLVEVEAADGSWKMRARAMDAGPLAGHRVDQWDLPVGADLPAHLAPFDGLSAPVRVTNVTAALRAEMERRAGR